MFILALTPLTPKIPFVGLSLLSNPTETLTMRAITSLKIAIDEENKVNLSHDPNKKSRHNEFSLSDIFCFTLSSRGDKVLAVASMGPGNAVAKAANEMFEGKMRSASEIR